MAVDGGTAPFTAAVMNCGQFWNEQALKGLHKGVF